MKAIGIIRSLPISDENSFMEFDLEKPVASGRDLLVEVAAVSVNPVDFKVRLNAAKDADLDAPKILGWDAAGTVIAAGENCTRFKAGDKVYYAGDITRAGSNAEFQLVDERIVGRQPAKLSPAQAAAMPLTTLTAWESLFDRIKVTDRDRGKSVLMLAGAGGVGSVAIQIAKKLTGLTVIATASRPDSADWCRTMGADFVVNHRSLKEELKKIGHEQVDYILDFVDIKAYWETAVEIIKPQGHIVSITDSGDAVNLNLLKTKSASFSWEFMYTRSMFQTQDMDEQHRILNEAADLLDTGTLKTTLTTTLQGFTLENLKEAHRRQESGKTIGKTVIAF